MKSIRFSILRFPVVLLAAVYLALFSAASPCVAQEVRQTKITDVRVGFPGGADQLDMSRRLLYRPGQWTPVYVDIEVGDKSLNRARLTVTSTDSDGVEGDYSVVFSAVQRESLTVLAYARPSGNSTNVTITITSPDETVKKSVYISGLHTLDDYLFLFLDHSLPGFRQALQKQQSIRVGEGEGIVALSMTQASTAWLQSASTLPDEWFAYEAVDLMVLLTSNPDFVKDLINPARKKQQQAISDWVRRGGRLVFSTGLNHDLAAALLALLFPDATVDIGTGTHQFQTLDGVSRWVNTLNDFSLPGNKPIETAKLKINGPHVEILISENNRPLFVRMPYGMGQVLISAFDLDRPPLSKWQDQMQFWRKLQSVVGVPLERGSGINRVDMASNLRDRLEFFSDVTNISFGWVALFIFVYILVVGPIDYLFLKNVVKRLELTWLTFPTVVVAVSAAAFFTAYWLKGDQLLINKIDLVDIAVDDGRSYGQSWFTLFSPRIQNYTIGIEPSSPTWTEEGKEADTSVVVNWLGRPDYHYGGLGRNRSPSLFRRSYVYANHLRGLIGVPIQVWDTKSFTASWEAPSAPGKIEGKFRMVPGLDLVEGTLTNRLPVDFEWAVLAYGQDRNQANIYSLGPWSANETRHVVLGKLPSMRILDWSPLQTEGGFVDPRWRHPTEVDTDDLMRRLTFYSLFSADKKEANALYRCLDRSWRLRLPGQIILFGKLRQQAGEAETTNQGAATTCRLWLGALPEKGKQRPFLPGRMTQTTYVRVYFPVRQSE
ncbi:MAG: hypothetical protein KatS3mg105_4820 [Gemmatales bacterium]|nr:MAG: hypothetical protein KatS3mg105_4820 [Gemmatales bacterium]